MTMKSGWCLTGRHGFYCRWSLCVCDCHRPAGEGDPSDECAIMERDAAGSNLRDVSDPLPAYTGSEMP